MSKAASGACYHCDLPSCLPGIEKSRFGSADVGFWVVSLKQTIA